MRLVAGELEEGRDRRLGIGVHLDAHRNGPPWLAKPEESVEAGSYSQFSCAKETPSCSDPPGGPGRLDGVPGHDPVLGTHP